MKSGPCTRRRERSPSVPAVSELRPGFPAAHGRNRLRLLPPGSDLVHERPSRGTWPSTPESGVLASEAAPLERGFSLARADCEYRTPLPSRLARSTGHGSGARVPSRGGDPTRRSPMTRRRRFRTHSSRRSVTLPPRPAPTPSGLDPRTRVVVTLAPLAVHLVEAVADADEPVLDLVDQAIGLRPCSRASPRRSYPRARRLSGTGLHPLAARPRRMGRSGRVAQWESARFTRERSLVRNQPRPSENIPAKRLFPRFPTANGSQ